MSSSSHATSEPPPRVLVVDDTRTNRVLLKAFLARQGYESLEAENGPDALAIIAQQAVDVVLLDIGLPGMDGFEVLRRMRQSEAHRAIPVLMISARDDEDSVARCIELGAVDHLPKPFNPVLLHARISACLAHKAMRDREHAHLEELEREKRRSDRLLQVILPHHVLGELKETSRVTPKRFEDVAVLFCDVVGFTAFCDKHPPEEVLAILQQLIVQFELISIRNDLEKIKTTGDAFMAVAGLGSDPVDPVLRAVRGALEMTATSQRLALGWQVRVGIHAGPLVAGVVGLYKYSYDVWGDTVNTAARVESVAPPGGVCLTRDAYERVAHEFEGAPLGAHELKGKGRIEIVRVLPAAKERAIPSCAPTPARSRRAPLLRAEPLR